jgi:hypothetical protein
MAIQLTAEDARQSMQAHVAFKGAEIHEKYGPHIGWNQLLALLQDKSCVRYPCEVMFDSSPLNDNEFAHATQKGERPEEGFTIFIHPYFATQLNRVPHLALYQLVLVNYGEFASADDAEIFGSHALGISTEEYYETLCAMVDEIATATVLQ